VKMSHEGPDLHNAKMFNLRQDIDNQGNEWWIFDWKGTPIETWSTESRARCFMKEFYKWNDRYGVPRVMLYRCIPGIGFVRQES
jgi:hypothetical protein